MANQFLCTSKSVDRLLQESLVSRLKGKRTNFETEATSRLLTALNTVQHLTTPSRTISSHQNNPTLLAAIVGRGQSAASVITHSKKKLRVVC
jgi:hypothetical protein